LNKRRRLSCRASFGNLDPTLEQGWRFGVGQSSRDGVEGSQSQHCKEGVEQPRFSTVHKVGDQSLLVLPLHMVPEARGFYNTTPERP